MRATRLLSLAAALCTSALPLCTVVAPLAMPARVAAQALPVPATVTAPAPAPPTVAARAPAADGTPAPGRAPALVRVPAAAAAPVAAAPPPSAHREYLQRLVLVLDGIRRTLRWVEMHPGNEPLARFSLPLAQQYVTMTGHMTPTEDLRLLHPHLLLIVENAKRAIAGLGAGDVRAYRAHVRTVREELRTLQSVLHHLEIELPEIPR